MQVARELTGEESLALAVLECGIEDASSGGKRMAEARHWLQSDTRAPFGFVALWELFDFDPEAIRRRILGGGVRMPTNSVTRLHQRRLEPGVNRRGRVTTGSRHVGSEPSVVLVLP